MTDTRATVYAVAVRGGAEYDCWETDSIWISREAAEAYAQHHFQQSGWGSPVPEWTIESYVLNMEG